MVIWREPDADGDAVDSVGRPKVVWEERFDNQNRSLGRNVKKDINGREIVEYLPPEGFVNRPSFDNKDCFVLVDDRGQIVRQPNGEAVNIRPGQALVFEPDGSVTVLEDEYAQYVFAQSNNSVVEAPIVEAQSSVVEAPIVEAQS